MPTRYGPTLGPGVSVTEKEAGNLISPSLFGVTCYVGQTEKGRTGEVIDCPKQRDFLDKCGTYRDGTELPDCAFDFYRASGGRGRLFVVRITDGNERAATDYLRNRASGAGAYVNRDTGTDQKLAMLSAAADNGGRWGSAKQILSLGFTILSDLTETTLDTGITMLEDEWKGAVLQLLGVTTKTYTVISNDVAGVLTVEADAKMASDLAADEAANDAAVLYIDAQIRNVNAPGQSAGDRQALSILWKDGEESQSGYFGMEMLIDGEVVRDYPNLSMDPTDKFYIDNVVNKDRDNVYAQFGVIHTGSFTSENRPAAWVGEFKSYASGTMSAEVATTRAVVPNTPGNEIGFAGDWVYPQRCARQRLTLTFVSPTEFTVATTAGVGEANHSGLPNGTVGTPYATTLASNSRALLDFLPTFTCFRGPDDFEAGDQLSFDIDPFPVELQTASGLLSGYVYIDEGGSRERLLIESNTPEQIVFANLPATPPTAAGDIAADLQSSSDITFPTTGGNVEIMCDAVGFVSLTYAAEADAATLVATLNAAALVAGLPNTLFSNVGDQLVIALTTAYAGASNNQGADQFFELVALPAELNIVAGVSQGTAGDKFRVEAPREFYGGYDGGIPSDADYIAAYNLADSPIKNLRGRKLGLVKLATPGVVSTNVQKSGVSFAAARNYQYHVEQPDNITSETSAVSYINDTIGRSNYSVTLWPSYAQVINPIGNGTVLQSLTGLKHGIEARVAGDAQGYHVAAAGDVAPLETVVELPTGERELDREVLNPQGINSIRKIGGVFYIYGSRTCAVDAAWNFKHAREYMSHTENVFLESFEWIVFKLNDEQQRNELIPVFRQYFNIELQKRAISGSDLDDAVTIKVDGENNSQADVDAGDMNADISFRIVGVVERLNISVSKKGVSSSAG